MAAPTAARHNPRITHLTRFAAARLAAWFATSQPNARMTRAPSSLAAWRFAPAVRSDARNRDFDFTSVAR
jgi:hypothetical protein